jgi:2-dehydro-3-deoxy-D-gluconate 5-dehydrogenase
MKEYDLKNRVAVVTGGRRGIGRSIALALARSGADVVICDIVADDGLLERTTGEIEALGRRALGRKVDISKRNDADAMVAAAVASFGRIDILVNCAGLWTPGQSLIDCPEDVWDRVIDTNLKGTFFCCSAAGKEMIKQRSGTIINLASQAGLNPGRSVGAYSISKAGIVMLTRQLALELAPSGIRVNALAPGIITTEFNRGVWADPTTAKRVSAAIPMGRMAGPDEIAGPALFLASDMSSYMTGAIVNVDGGWQVPVTDQVASVEE